MSDYEHFQRDDWQMELARDRREELEREDIMSIAVKPWLKAMTRAAVPQPVAALLDSMGDEWEAA